MSLSKAASLLFAGLGLAACAVIGPRPAPTELPPTALPAVAPAAWDAMYQNPVMGVALLYPPEYQRSLNLPTP